MGHANDAKFIEYVRSIVTFNRKLVQAFAAAGIPVLSGTDTPVPGLVPGFALHDELEAMARYGLSNGQVLEGSTRLPVAQPVPSHCLQFVVQSEARYQPGNRRVRT